MKKLIQNFILLIILLNNQLLDYYHSSSSLMGKERLCTYLYDAASNKVIKEITNGHLYGKIE